MTIATKYFKTKHGEVRLRYWDNGEVTGIFKKEKGRYMGTWMYSADKDRQALATAARKLKIRVAHIDRYEVDYVFTKFFMEY